MSGSLVNARVRAVGVALAVSLLATAAASAADAGAERKLPEPVGYYALYQLVLENAVIKREPGGMVAYPIVANLHCVNGKMAGGWLDGRQSGLQKYRRDGPSMVEPKGLRIHNGRLHGVLSIVSCWNRYDYRIDADIKDGAVEGAYEKGYGKAPEGEKEVRGGISIPNLDLTQKDDASYRVRTRRPVATTKERTGPVESAR